MASATTDTLTISGDSAAETAGTDGAASATYGHERDAFVTQLRFTPDAAVTANDTNYADISVEIDGTEIASEQTTTGDTGNLTAGTDIALALTDDGTALELSQNSVVGFKFTKAGTSVAINGDLTVTYRFDRIGAG